MISLWNDVTIRIYTIAFFLREGWSGMFEPEVASELVASGDSPTHLRGASVGKPERAKVGHAQIAFIP